MTKPDNKSIVRNVVSSAKTATEFITEDLSPLNSKMLKIPIFTGFLLLLILIAPFVYLTKLLNKSAINPFFMLRTELETNWYKGQKDEAINKLRIINSTIKENEHKIFASGVNVPPYGKFKFNDYLKLLWLLYHWEFQSGELDRASEVCDYFIEQYGTLRSRKLTKQYSSKYYSQWVVNKAEIILKQQGSMAAEQFLLKYTDPQDNTNLVNQFLYDLRNRKKID